MYQHHYGPLPDQTVEVKPVDSTMETAEQLDEPLPPWKGGRIDLLA